MPSSFRAMQINVFVCLICSTTCHILRNSCTAVRGIIMYFYDTNSPRSAWRLQPRWNWIFLLDRCFFRPLRVRISEQKVEDHLFCVKQESRFSFSPKSTYGIKFVVHIWFWRSGIFPVRHLQSLEFFMSPMFEIRLFKRHRIRIEIKWWGDH